MPNNYTDYFRRSLARELQHVEIDSLKGVIEGYPIVFNQRALITTVDGKQFYEEIDPHALDEADLSDIKFMVNHNDSMIPLARHRRGKRSTMDVAIDEIGMRIKTQLDIENNMTAREVCSAVTRGDMDDMSFIFGIRVSGQEWRDVGVEGTIPTRCITKISRVCEVAVVNDGAYPQTSIYARSAGTLDNDKTALDNAVSAALENENRAIAAAALRLQKEKYLFLRGKRS